MTSIFADQPRSKTTVTDRPPQLTVARLYNSITTWPERPEESYCHTIRGLQIDCQTELIKQGAQTWKRTRLSGSCSRRSKLNL